MKNISNHIINYFHQISMVSDKIDKNQIEKLVKILIKIRNKKGRIFFLGMGGSASNCSHAVNDFRKICEIECYAPTDNVSELTARINDDGWESALANWLKVSNLNSRDAIFIMSVGGGNKKKNVSVNLIKAIEFAKKKSARILGIVGRDGGYTKKVGDDVILIPTIDKKLVTPYCESFHSIVWHCLVSHPLLQIKKMKW
jgi:D-sedoheptulose 7-phosphate isomerase